MDAVELLKSGAAELGVVLGTAELDAFGVYLSELVKWNRKVNLTAIERPDEIVVKHFLDSLALARLLPEGPFDAADIGAGAGFPGIPLKIVRPEMRLVLIEPARKKATFMRHVIRLLGLSGAVVAEEKVEDSARVHPGGFDLILSRAFTEPGRLIALVSPLVRPDGILAISLGPETALAEVPGWAAARTEELTLPGSAYRRRLVAYRFIS